MRSPIPAHGSRRSRGSHSRHGRSLRSSPTGPFLPQPTGRIPRFNQVVGETLGFLRGMAPEQMRDVRVLISPMPVDERDHRGMPADGMQRWRCNPPHEVVLYRVPIERLARMPLSNPELQPQYREYVERTVIAAVGQLLDGGLDGIINDDLLGPRH
ncbi:hypothetical protein [Gulosibacter bifidus]|uniref:Metallopeptidase family protein n=1 Tax=Gulosibacter bifidus TaxID=272239 RepID=A0ABW5RIF7_9MICO|nr:hypothetical protein [Gulosibacter bifidus]